MDTRATETVSLPDAPAIPGLTFRHFRGEEDYPAMLEVNNGSKVADGLDHDLHTLDSLVRVYSSTRNHDPHKDVLIAEVGGKMVAYNRVYWGRQLETSRIYWHHGFVLPEWRGEGLGRAMLRWAEERAREIEAAQEDAGSAEARTTVYQSMSGLENLLITEGYEPVRYEFHMERPDLDHIPDIPMPNGLEVRPVRPEHYRAIWEATEEVFRELRGEGADFDSWINHPAQQPDLWVVAWDGDEVAGSILNNISHNYNARTGRKLGHTSGISVRRPWRGKGLAQALLARSMKMHKDLGMTQVAGGVDTQNPTGALQLLESMGYKVISQITTYRKQL